jgi:hypothetical protein
MTERTDHHASTERETAALSASGEIRKGIEIVTVQDVPADFTPPTMGLGGSPPADDSASDSGAASE